MIFDEEAVISADRALEAITWLRERITRHCSAEEAGRQMWNVQTKPTTIQSIEAIRKVVQEREKQHEETTRAIQTLTKQYEWLCKQWQDGGGNVIRDMLDPDALCETDTLADVFAALKLDAEHSLSKSAQVTALSRLAEEYVGAEDRRVEREYAVGQAHEAIRDGMEELRNAVQTLDGVQRDVRKGEVASERLLENTRAMQEEVRNCEEARVVASEEVEKCGVEAGVRHETIAKDGERLRELEQKLEAIKLELEKYHGLPADMEICGEMVSGMKAQVGEIDKEIEEAIASMK
ncbi:hypothetical protein BWQ96_07634 [Gracilariopsis chorda]|uniref:Uncharacterized protein n=1 Tax=Gracilariopsis chorda TaxID=448386 RepID=A0A2V3IND0_9FLOR|nr:hypothetical protein BWQ96_07634 [Gracilariopsis chorda]|eukprot:PXF42630.1 hypothetical protein BWQ96_07634 [Gracilariopsis chorda]